jgi:hypothetical protein
LINKGSSKSFNCSTDVPLVDSFNYRQAQRAIDINLALFPGKVGIVWPQFSGALNKAPSFSWTEMSTYPSMDGICNLINTTFAYFSSNRCTNKSDVILATNPRNNDLQHPIEIFDTFLHKVDDASKLFIHLPNEKSINPLACGDMDCDGFKKVILNDNQGAFLGVKGSVIPQASERYWGNASRGIGDFKVPRELLADPLTGNLRNMSAVYSHLGIVRDEKKCAYTSEWNAYNCSGSNFKLLLIESLDSDSETRRVAPVAIVDEEKRFLDLINGPQTYSKCTSAFGECRKRVSTFFAVIAPSRAYDD